MSVITVDNAFTSNSCVKVKEQNSLKKNTHTKHHLQQKKREKKILTNYSNKKQKSVCSHDNCLYKKSDLVQCRTKNCSNMLHHIC